MNSLISWSIQNECEDVVSFWQFAGQKQAIELSKLVIDISHNFVTFYMQHFIHQKINDLLIAALIWRIVAHSVIQFVTCFVPNYFLFHFSFSYLSNFLLTEICCVFSVIPVSCGLTGSLLWLAGRISSLTTSEVLPRSCMDSIREQCSVLVPSIDKRMSPTCNAPHLREWDRGRLC